jgi:hypothetical protein
MAFLKFLQTPAGRTARVVTGLLLLAYGALSPTLPGIVALMAGIAGVVTGLTRLPQ